MFRNCVNRQRLCFQQQGSRSLAQPFLLRDEIRTAQRLPRSHFSTQAYAHSVFGKAPPPPHFFQSLSPLHPLQSAVGWKFYVISITLVAGSYFYTLSYFKKLTIEAHPVHPEKFKPWTITDIEKLSPTATVVEVLHPPLNGTEAQIERRQTYWEYLWDAGLCAFEVDQPDSQGKLLYTALPPLAVDHSIAPSATTAVLPPADGLEGKAKDEGALPEEVPVPIRFYINGTNTPEGTLAHLFHKKGGDDHQIHDFMLSQPLQTTIQLRGPKYLWKYPLGITTVHGVTTVQSVLFIAGDSTAIPAALQVARKMLTTHYNLDMRILLLGSPETTPEALPSDLAEWQKKFPGRLSLKRCDYTKDGQLRKQIKNGFADIGAFEVDEQGSRLVIISLPPGDNVKKFGVDEGKSLSTTKDQTVTKEFIVNIINQLTGGEKNKDLEVVDLS